MALLDDVRVVDLSVARGQLCARVLADLGADVVRVVAADADPPTLSNVYRNANKRVLTLDLHDARARDRLHELLRGADLLVESFDPGELAAIDDALDPVALATRYPHLVVTSITAFGLTGPYRDHASSELVLQAVGGSLFRAGSAARPPCAAPGSYASDIAGATAALGSLLALRQARASGRGQHIDVAAIEALAHCTDWALPLWSVLGTDQQRAGAPLYPLFPCADGLVRLVLPMTMRDWWSLYHWLDAPELAGRTPTFPGMPVEERQFVCDLVARAFAGRTRMDLTRAALDAGVAVTPVLLPGEVLTNEHAVSRGLGIDIGLPDGRRGLAPAGFYSVDGERAGIRTPATPITAAPDWTPRPAPV
ncbi:MAG TPA: CoA transferase [Acidimicrobiales bacterium]|nr:CoA transferase [Acidimicrobiales bacterium]